MSTADAANMILANAMAVAGKHYTEHAMKNAITVISPHSVKTTSVEECMKDMRGDAPMSECDMEAWNMNVQRLHHTVTNDTEDRMWFVTRQGEHFHVLHVDRQRCIDAYFAYMKTPTLDDAVMRIQGCFLGYMVRQRG